MLFRVAIRDHFDAAHFLKGYCGKCAQLHGHRWVVEIHVAGADLDGLGMLVDFGLLKEKLSIILTGLDHHLINELEYFQAINPTAENLARYVYDEFNSLPPGVKLQKVRVYETPDAWAEFGEG